MFVLAPLCALAQQSQQNESLSPPPAITYLVRLERSVPGEKLCSLIARGGKYHFERTAGGKIEISEGVMLMDRVQQIEAVMTNGEVEHLSQEKIGNPLVVTGFDLSSAAFQRPTGWQRLVFVGSSTRKRFPMMEPLWETLNTLNKQRRADLRHDMQPTHCMPPGYESVSALSSWKKLIGTDNDSDEQGWRRASAAGFVMTLKRLHFDKGRRESTCVIIYRSGHFHKEVTVPKWDPASRVQVFEGTIEPQQLQGLGQLLDAEPLRSLEHRRIPSDFFQESEMTELLIPRLKGPQILVFSNNFVPRTRFAEPGIAPKKATQGVDRDEKLIQPVQRWLKENIDQAAGKPLKDAVPNRCDPEPSR